MLDLTNPQYISKLLEQHQLSTKKKFGQNFLINRSVLDKSLEIAQITQDDIVVEIGAGIGVLTRELAQKARKVIAFEVDQSLRPILDQTLGEFNNIDVHFEDFRQVNLNELLLTQLETSQVSPVKIPGANDYLTSSYKVVANLPYNAGTHIIGQLLQLQHSPQTITVLLQKEVAQKFTANPPHATYLSNIIQLYGHPEVIQIVKPGSFYPPPKVDSAILHITRHAAQSATPYATFSRFLHRGFASPRKKINKAFEIEALQQADIDPNLRPENLQFAEWMKLFQIINS